jgi:hypothetical protein
MTPKTRYRDAAAFRAALNDRLRISAVGKSEGWLVRRRKFMVFDRLLTRLMIIAPDRWVLKGAVALDFRLGERARSTMDLDLHREDSEAEAMTDLIAAQTLDIGDYFSFQIERTNKLDELEDGTAVRYRVTAQLGGRPFDRVILDVGFDHGIASPPDILLGPDFFAFAGVEPILIPTIPLAQHVAEKLQAYSRTYQENRPSSRVKDLIDLVLIAENSALEASALRSAIEMTFSNRDYHVIPAELAQPPEQWLTTYRALADETGLAPDIAVGHAIAARFLNPILSQEIPGAACWAPELGRWQ